MWEPGAGGDEVYDPLVSLDVRTLDRPSSVKASPMLKPPDDTRFLSIRKRP